MGYRVAIVNLGCPKNTVDAEEMAGVLRRAGHDVLGDPSQADVVIVNTCGFIKSAQDESLQTLRQLKQTLARTGCKLIAAGCLSQRLGAKSLNGLVQVDAVCGVGQMAQIEQVVQQAIAGTIGDAVPPAPSHQWAEVSDRTLSAPNWSAYLKISEGCDHRCSFCTIPSFRGRHISKPMSRVMAEAENLASLGVKELVVIAQDTTQYGQDISGQSMLPELLGELSAMDSFPWIRVMYAYPTRLDDRLVKALTTLRGIVPYIDMPLQHSEDELLRLMKRSHSKLPTLELLKRLREANPDLALRTSMIVGFPGETDAHFDALLAFCVDAQFDRLGAFVYSAEEGTPAASLDNQVPAKVAMHRYDKLMRQQRLTSYQRNHAWIGRSMQVLIEQRVQGKPRLFQGRSFRDAPEIDGSVYVTARDLVPGEFVDVIITGADSYDLQAQIISSP
ncbi:MAG: 30S ribosomal protein S12 methylthiotransferase RimO [Armatimonadota bacterium]